MPTLSRELAAIYYDGKPLSRRQREILYRIALGMTGTEAAADLGVSYETVKRHLSIVRAKLKARTTCHAVALAMSYDLI